MPGYILRTSYNVLTPESLHATTFDVGFWRSLFYFFFSLLQNVHYKLHKYIYFSKRRCENSISSMDFHVSLIHLSWNGTRNLMVKWCLVVHSSAIQSFRLFEMVCDSVLCTFTIRIESLQRYDTKLACTGTACGSTPWTPNLKTTHRYTRTCTYCVLAYVFTDEVQQWSVQCVATCYYVYAYICVNIHDCMLYLPVSVSKDVAGGVCLLIIAFVMSWSLLSKISKFVTSPVPLMKNQKPNKNKKRQRNTKICIYMYDKRSSHIKYILRLLVAAAWAQLHVILVVRMLHLINKPTNTHGMILWIDFMCLCGCVRVCVACLFS